MAGSAFKLFASAPLVKALRVPQGGGMSRKEIDDLTEFVKIYGAQGLAWIKIHENEWQSPIAKFLSEKERAALTRETGIEPGDIIFFQAGEAGMVNAALGNLRVKLAQQLGLIPENSWNFLWVTDFPLFEYSEEEQRYVACHHPFTAVQEESRNTMLSDPASAKARAYDMVLNGNEVGGGSIRIHTPEDQYRTFEALGFSDESAKSPVRLFHSGSGIRNSPPRRHCLRAGSRGMLLTGASSIRDVIAFPKTQKATCLLTDAPDTVSAKQLRELGLRLRENPRRKIHGFRRGSQNGVSMLRPVLQYPDPRLAQKSVEVPEIDEEIRQLAQDMLDTLKAIGGVGIAAPQIGVFKRSSSLISRRN